MLNNPPRNASATARPVKISGAVYVNVSLIGNSACDQLLRPENAPATVVGLKIAPSKKFAYAVRIASQAPDSAVPGCAKKYENWLSTARLPITMRIAPMTRAEKMDRTEITNGL